MSANASWSWARAAPMASRRARSSCGRSYQFALAAAHWPASSPASIPSPKPAAARAAAAETRPSPALCQVLACHRLHPAPKHGPTRPLTPVICTIVAPKRLGRFLPRWAKMPTRGQAKFSRGWRARPFDRVSRHPVEKKENLRMRKGVEASQAFWVEVRGEFDDGLHVPPVVVAKPLTGAADVADRCYRKAIHRRTQLSTPARRAT